MASDFIAIDPGDLARTTGILKKCPDYVRDIAVDQVAKFYVNTFRRYPPHKKVSRREAYGQTFQSDKQRRKVMAMIREDLIPYRRTQTLSRGWRQVGSGQQSIVANEVAYGAYVMGDGEQANMMKLIGWDTTTEAVNKHLPRIDRILTAAAEKGMRKAGAK